jgi:peroxiredoxin
MREEVGRQQADAHRHVDPLLDQVDEAVGQLPLPAAYVIDRGGRIVFAHVEADYRERAEPDHVMRSVAEAARP